MGIKDFLKVNIESLGQNHPSDEEQNKNETQAIELSKKLEVLITDLEHQSKRMSSYSLEDIDEILKKLDAENARITAERNKSELEKKKLYQGNKRFEEDKARLVAEKNISELERKILEEENARLAGKIDKYNKEMENELEGESSKSLIQRTEKNPPSTASSLIKFYEEEYKPTPMKSHLKEPWESVNGYKNWEMDKDTLFLGFKTFKSLLHKKNIPEASQLQSDEIAVLMVDVAPEFEPNIKASRNKEEMKVIMFVGETGAGKTTQINAFFSYLFDCDLSDQKRILVVDDRKCEDEEALSTTKYITVYRIRPFSDLFNGKTFYIIELVSNCLRKF